MHAVLEARRAAPAILHLPHLQLWWETAPPSLRATLCMLLADLPGDLPLLLLASSDAPLDQLDEVLIPSKLIHVSWKDAVRIPRACLLLVAGLGTADSGDSQPLNVTTDFSSLCMSQCCMGGIVVAVRFCM